MSDQTNKKPPKVEIGWIIAGTVPDEMERALEAAKMLLLEYLREKFSGFQWNIVIVPRLKLVRSGPVKSVNLLEHAVDARDAHHWDFSVAFTSASMRGAAQTSIFGAISRSLDSGVVALRALDPEESGERTGADDGGSVMASRIRSLVIHYLGHFVGLDHAEAEDNYMCEVTSPADLDRMNSLTDPQIEAAREELQAVADERLEEQRKKARAGNLYFYVRSMALNRRDILDSVIKARPWLFPVHLSRLTTAAISTAMIMIVTAEVWEIATRLTAAVAVFLPVVVILLTTIYVLVRQRLLVRKKSRYNTEQRVTTNVSTSIVVLLGMITTWLLTFSLTTLMASVLFPRGLIVRWVGESDLSLTAHYGLLSILVGSVGLAIGALGASFESQEYFRHVTYVDEEF